MVTKMKNTHTPCISFLSPEQLRELSIVALLLRRGWEESQCCKLPRVSISLYFPESETGFHILHPNPSTAPHTLVVVNQFLSKGKRNSPAAGSVSAMQGSTGSSPERLPRTGISVDFPVPQLSVCVCAKLLQSCRLYKTSWTAALQAPLPKGVSRQEYRSGLPCPPPGDLPAVASGFFTASATWEAQQLVTAAAAAKSLQSCPPGSPVPGILQARTVEWVAISFSNAGK